VVRVFLYDAVDAAETAKLQTEFEGLSGVKSASHVSKKAALQKLREALGARLGPLPKGRNPLPASFELSAGDDPGERAAVITALEDLEGPASSAPIDEVVDTALGCKPGMK
jgi:cell division protein FtsX